MKKLSESGHSSKMMWGCVALIALVAILTLSTGSSYVLFFVLPCMLMMGAMVWMMMGGGGKEGGGH
jgi:hypothetical protein